MRKHGLKLDTDSQSVWHGRWNGGTTCNAAPRRTAPYAAHRGCCLVRDSSPASVLLPRKHLPFSRLVPLGDDHDVGRVVRAAGVILLPTERSRESTRHAAMIIMKNHGLPLQTEQSPSTSLIVVKPAPARTSPIGESAH
jgi:hypothetical protein